MIVKVKKQMIQNPLETFSRRNLSNGFIMRKKVEEISTCYLLIFLHLFNSIVLDDDDETRAWRRQYFHWALKVESVDTGDICTEK